MIQNSDFILKTINGSSYLLPTGQSISDHKRGLKLNETGICIWEFLKTEHSSMEVITTFCSATVPPVRKQKP